MFGMLVQYRWILPFDGVWLWWGWSCALNIYIIVDIERYYMYVDRYWHSSDVGLSGKKHKYLDYYIITRIFSEALFKRLQ